MRTGVIVDAGRREDGANPTRDDDYWLPLYVMLSRASRLYDILLERAPPVTFLAQGPPGTLARQLRRFATHAARCREAPARPAAAPGLPRTGTYTAAPPARYDPALRWNQQTHFN